MKRLIFAAVFALSAYSHLNAQTLNTRAEVPFNFQVGEAFMPAGKYLIKESGNLLTVREEHGREAAMHLTFPASHSAVSPFPKLEFNRYGDEYFLATIWDPQSHDGRALMKSKREKELASHFRSIQIASVRAQ